MPEYKIACLIGYNGFVGLSHYLQPDLLQGALVGKFVPAWMALRWWPTPMKIYMALDRQAVNGQ